MSSIEPKSTRAGRLSKESIQALSDEEVATLASERPGRPGQYGFLFNPDDFESEQHLSDVSTALMKRLMMIENVDEMMARNKDGMH